MAKQRDKPYGADPTTITLLVACFVGICVLYSLEFVYRAFRDSTPGNTPLLPSWRAHMGSVCVGMAAFVIVFFFLQGLEGKPRPIAWRAASSWSPLIALTAFATAVHIPWYAVVLGCAGFGLWAYRRTRAATLTLT
jgi:hypothetical protein